MMPTDATRSTILLIRTAEMAFSAVEMLNQLLAYRRRNTGDEELREEILAVWFRKDLETNLPVWHSAEQPLDTNGSRPARGRAWFAAEQRSVAAGIAKSIELSGLWSLCWIDGTAVSGIASRQQRRLRILEALTRNASGTTSDQDLFCPVLGKGEAPGTLLEILRELRSVYPGRVEDLGFREDPERGIVLPATRNRELANEP